MNDNFTPPSAFPAPQAPTPAPQATFWQRYTTTIIRLGIVAVIIIGAVIYSKTQKTSPPTTGTPDTVSALPTSTLPVISAPTVPPATSPPAAATAPAPATDARVGAGTITVAAQRGNGYTHLARHALKAYLDSAASKPQLKPEHKIYIEDYLQKRLNKRIPLITGTEVTFQQTDIDQAIDRALKLNERQLQNLHRYTLRVKNL